MNKVQISAPSLEALGNCLGQLIDGVSVPSDAQMRESPHGFIEVPWLRLRFSNGGQLDLWPEIVVAPETGQEIPVLNASAASTSRSAVVSNELTQLVRDRQIREIQIASNLEGPDDPLLIDTGISLLLDDEWFEFQTYHKGVGAMLIGMRSNNVFQPTNSRSARIRG